VRNKIAIKIADLNKALVMMELGTSRDSQKMKIVMENLKTLTPLVHG
jgi:myo-inositol-1(or 4)-monophosphatase